MELAIIALKNFGIFLLKSIKEKNGMFTVFVLLRSASGADRRKAAGKAKALRAPEENPIENVWGQLKQMLRSLFFWCRSFQLTKKLFEMLAKYQLFTLPDLNKYDAFSSII